MKAIILAAGIGSRLQPYTNEIPKCLLEVNNETLLSRQLRILENSGIKKVIIVTGYKAEKIEKEVLKFNQLDICFVNNKNFIKTNPIDSFLLCEPYIDSHFILLNSDIYFHDSIINKMLAKDGNCVVIDSSSEYSKNEFIVNHDERYYVTQIEKNLPHRPYHQGISVQISKFDLSGKNRIFEKVKKNYKSSQILFPTDSFDVLVKQKSLYAVDIAGSFWYEIDTVEGYLNLNKILKSADSEIK